MLEKFNPKLEWYTKKRDEKLDKPLSEDEKFTNTNKNSFTNWSKNRFIKFFDLKSFEIFRRVLLNLT